MQDIKHKIDCAMGRVKCDTVLKNANVVDVFCHKINKCDVAITDGKIVGLGEYSGNIEIDVEGKYVLPSFYDTHLHFESSMLTPDEYIKLIAPKGVTMINADPHEIANVCGLDGINFMLESTINSPVKINFMFPSCVPATPFDHGNAVLDSAIIAEQMKKGNFFGLAEMMNYPGVINADSDVLKKIETSNHIDGHAPRLNGKELNAYLTTGITTDHECETVDEVFEKVSKGMFVMIREGSQTKNLKYLIKSFNEYTKRRLIFCTDDRYVGDIIESGSISNCIATSIESGVDPIDAIIMGSLNAYDCYGIPNKGAVAINYDADLIVSSDLSTLNIDMVFCGGVKIAEKGKALFDIKKANQSKVINTVNIKEVTEKDFDLPF
ncbi:MAG: amidohydrolase family protein, partial [Clostridia bacterium]